MRRGTLVITAALVVLLAGCGDDGGESADEDQTESTTTETAEGEDGDTTTTAPEATTTTVAAEGPEEWVEVVRDVYERWYQQLHDPDLDRLSDVYAPDCECYEEKSGTIERLADNRWHVEGQAENVLAVRLADLHETEMVSPDGQEHQVRLVTLTVRAQANPLRVVDGDGALIEEHLTDVVPGCVSLSLRWEPDEVYRVTGERALTGCPEEWG